ncbi:MAG TPA: transglutaminase-like domain-containing protein [Thermoanaerobaculia bacterium]|jgi:transglutaminase-like putative cysteine protease|nr:transglutaminase-like domain-containing protein [Thermoanaerobaculia bacterium]
MNRRSFLQSAGVLSASVVLPKSVRALTLGVPSGEPWRTFEVTTRVEVLKPAGTTRVWLPAALIRDTSFQKTLSNDFRAEGGAAELVRNEAESLGIVSATFPEGVRPIVTLTSRVTTRDFVVDLASKAKAPKADAAELQYWRQPTRMLPTDGIVKSEAALITKDAKTDLDKARVIYDWIVDNTYRNPKTRGCGVGDIKFMLESKDLGGKCADLNALYVGIARAAGLPARDMYGVRVAKSEKGYKSLGTSTEVCTKGQHCRAEVWIEQYGWVPVDPADVRKVVLEEPPGNLPIDDPKVVAARKRLFGSWEMNWMAFNHGADVALPGSSGKPLNYFMYPQAETSEGRIDPLDADNFKYEITSTEIGGA